MAAKDTLENISGSAAMTALIAAIPIFLVLITYGWHEILKAVVPTAVVSWAPWLLGFLISIIGIMLARAVAAERLRLMIVKNAKSKYSWIAPFIVLFSISALGSINTFFILFQGKNVVLEAFSETNANLEALEQAINKDLETPLNDTLLSENSKKQADAKEVFTNLINSLNQDLVQSKSRFEQKKASAEAAWSQFQTEMLNPLQMGFGIAARQRFAELKTYLPDLAAISGLDKLNQKSSPEKIKDAIKVLGLSVEQQMKKEFSETKIICNVSQETNQKYNKAKEKIPNLQSLMSATSCEKFTDQIKSFEIGFDNLAKNLTGTHDPKEEPIIILQNKAKNDIFAMIQNNNEFMQSNPKMPLEEARLLLEKSWTAYESLFMQYKNLLPKGSKVSLPGNISMPSVRNLGEIGNVLPILMSRLTNLTTYFIFFGALLFDVILIVIYKRYLEIRVDDGNHNSPFDDPDINNPAPNILGR